LAAACIALKKARTSVPSAGVGMTVPPANAPIELLGTDLRDPAIDVTLMVLSMSLRHPGFHRWMKGWSLGRRGRERVHGLGQFGFLESVWGNTGDAKADSLLTSKRLLVKVQV